MSTVTMDPHPDGGCVRFVGDCLTFKLTTPLLNGTAFLRTTLGRGKISRQITIAQHRQRVAKSESGQTHFDSPPPESAWRDVPMIQDENGWHITVALAEVGFFEAKVFIRDDHDNPHWPDGANYKISVHPNHTRTANTIYCAFTRMFGDTKNLRHSMDESLVHQLNSLDKLGYAVIPPSGKFRDLKRELPHIFERVGCRILHLLPVNPTPTTYARFGRFGSPYACQDLAAIDPSLVEFDRLTTGVEQFCELTAEVHRRNGRVFLDVVINHTGWGSREMDNFPAWFLRSKEGEFKSPGAWGTVWEDLAELDHGLPLSWEYMAEVFLTWCQRGVDGFRCDAGYKIPVPCWKFIVARVRDLYPETVFLLEGLGGSWEATQSLVQEGGMQWAYSELFQNYSPHEVSRYLDHCKQHSEKWGLLVHYSETHDNDRLAMRGREWSLFRNELSALTSVGGAYGFTCGVEWLAAEKVNVHSSRGLSWGDSENIVAELARINNILRNHPCFFDDVKTERWSELTSPIYALNRKSSQGEDDLLVLINLDPLANHTFQLYRHIYESAGCPRYNLLSNATAELHPMISDDVVTWSLKPMEALCLANHQNPQGMSGKEYREARARAAFAFQALQEVLSPEQFGHLYWKELAQSVDENAVTWLSSIDELTLSDDNSKNAKYPQVITWQESDQRRILMIPPNHWLLLRYEDPFRANLIIQDHPPLGQRESVKVKNGNVVWFRAPANLSMASAATLTLEPLISSPKRIFSKLCFLSGEPAASQRPIFIPQSLSDPARWPMVLLTNGRGAMARFCVQLGQVKSKYDCLLGANLHPTLPVDRHVFVKRARIWVDAGGLVTELQEIHLVSFDRSPLPKWIYRVATATGGLVSIKIEAGMVHQANTTFFRFTADSGNISEGLKLIVRVDIEDRSFHCESNRNEISEAHFRNHCRPLDRNIGFSFVPSNDRELHVFASHGEFFPDEEWSSKIDHPIESTRGQTPTGDAYSPGWFRLPLMLLDPVQLILTAEAYNFNDLKASTQLQFERTSSNPSPSSFEGRLIHSIQSFIVNRTGQKTVIAGYPWFLDWGRDSLICARGLIAAGLFEDVKALLLTFGRYEENGTFPNSIHGDDTSNRDTVDAPLWFGIVCEELVEQIGSSFYQLKVDATGRTVLQVLESIGNHYLSGTANGIHVDCKSGLVWSPSHFTWMDTQHPAGTPREGYAIEIQALWIRLLQQLHRLTGLDVWDEVKNLATTSLHKYFWLDGEGYFSDCLLAPRGCAAEFGIADEALRSNSLLPISLSLVNGERAQQTVQAAIQWLLVPGALRSLAPKPLSRGAPIYSNHGHLLNDPFHPYWGKYEDDEDTRRKPAYHNGTAWTWTLPCFCEAVAKAWNYSPEATTAARAWLGSVDRLLEEGCLGHLPEIIDGDAPHIPRGCDAQAWGTTEVLRVWRLLNQPPMADPSE